MPAPDAALRYDLRARALSAATERAVLRLWDEVPARGDWAAAWDVGAAVRAVTASQLAAARDAETYLAEVLPQVGLADDAAGRLDPAAFAGVASDGRDLAGLLEQPIVRARAAGGGVEGLAAGRAQLQLIVATQLADAGREAVQVGIVARPRVGGYVRMLVGKSCPRCVILAGRWYRWSDGFRRHERCFPAGVVVSGPRADAATRRWYQGELTIIRTASGKQLPATGNHPVLTDRGWLPANLIQEGDHVVGSALGDGAVPLVVPHEQQVPARIEDVWGSPGMALLRSVPTSAEDFHGDGGQGEVDVVSPDGLLGDGFEAALQELVEQEPLAVAADPADAFAARGLGVQVLVGQGHAAHGLVGGGSLGGTLLGRHLRGTHQAGVGMAAALDAFAVEALGDDRTGDAVAAAEAALALAPDVRLDDLGDRKYVVPARWDAPAAPFAVKTRAAYASRGNDLRLRLSGQVAADRVVEVSRVEWSGHVYNLTSSEGWFSANGLIVSNCDCRHIPASEDAANEWRTDPRLAIERGQVRGFTRAQLRAIGDGADPAQVVNASRGTSTATVGGRTVRTTSEGTTRRGYASYVRRAIDEQRGTRTPETSMSVGPRGFVQNYTARRLRRPRLMPGEIYRVATSRDDAVRLLVANGYVLPARGQSLRQLAATVA